MDPDVMPDAVGSFFLEFIRQSPDPIWMFTPDWSQVLFVSDAYESLWGRSIDDLRADSTDFLAGVHPNDRALVKEKMAELSAEESIELEYRVNESKDFGRHVWVKGKPIYDERGEFMAVAGFVRDITEKRQLERELDQMLNQMDDAVFVHRPDGDFLAINQAAIDHFGYSETELHSMNPDDLVADDQTRPTDRIDRIMADGSLVFETTFATKQGVEIPVEINASKIEFQNDDAVLALVRDITERRARARELQVRNEQLEVLNRVVRHDIRNDMTVVMGWLDALAEDLESESDQEIIDRVQKAGQHVIELTETAGDLLDVVTGEGSITPTQMKIAPKLRTAIDIADESYPDATVSIDGEIPDVEVVGTELLGSVFHNLINNAIQHNDRGDAQVTVSVTTADSIVRIEVADNGPGIPESVRESMFQKGASAPDSSSTGIGLFLVETLVRQLGGTITVTENDPQGAVFIVELQRAGAG